jgi:hypothetical protein
MDASHHTGQCQVNKGITNMFKTRKDKHARWGLCKAAKKTLGKRKGDFFEKLVGKVTVKQFNKAARMDNIRAVPNGADMAVVDGYKTDDDFS